MDPETDSGPEKRGHQNRAGNGVCPQANQTCTFGGILRNPAITARNIATGVSRRIESPPSLDGRTTSIAAELDPGLTAEGGQRGHVTCR